MERPSSYRRRLHEHQKARERERQLERELESQTLQEQISKFEVSLGIGDGEITTISSVSELLKKRQEEEEEANVMGIQMPKSIKRSLSPLEFYDYGVASSPRTKKSSGDGRTEIGGMLVEEEDGEDTARLSFGSSRRSTTGKKPSSSSLLTPKLDLRRLREWSDSIAHASASRSDRIPSPSVLLSIRNVKEFGDVDSSSLAFEPRRPESGSTATTGSLSSTRLRRKEGYKEDDAGPSFSFSLQDPCLLQSRTMKGGGPGRGKRRTEKDKRTSRTQFQTVFRKMSDFSLHTPRTEKKNDTFRKDVGEFFDDKRERELEEARHRVQHRRRIERLRLRERKAADFEAAVRRGEPFVMKKLQHIHDEYLAENEDMEMQEFETTIRREMGLDSRSRKLREPFSTQLDTPISRSDMTRSTKEALKSIKSITDVGRSSKSSVTIDPSKRREQFSSQRSSRLYGSQVSFAVRTTAAEPVDYERSNATPPPASREVAPLWRRPAISSSRRTSSRTVEQSTQRSTGRLRSFRAELPSARSTARLVREDIPTTTEATEATEEAARVMRDIDTFDWQLRVRESGNPKLKS